MEIRSTGNPIHWVRTQIGDKYAELLGEIQRAAITLDLEVFVVGGTVRDWVLGKELKDIDLSVIGDALVLVDEISKNLDITIVKYKKFHTATIKTAEIEIDVVSARSEIYNYGGALPEITLGNLNDDLRRRDFSINAMAISMNTPYEFMDPLKGMTDLDKGIIRILHDQSFIDDPTRLFRMFRYASRFDFAIESETCRTAETAIAENCLTTISKERLTHEMVLILNEPNTDSAVKYLIEFDVLGIPGVYNPLILFSTMKQELKWVALMSMYEKKYYEMFFQKFSLDRQNANAIKEFINLCSILDDNDADLLNEMDIGRMYLLLKGIPRITLDAYVICNINTDLVKLLQQYMMYTDRVKINLNGMDLINLGVDKNQISEVIDVLIIKTLKGEISSKSEEELIVVQYVNGSND
ncbi:MAG: hypothetical protein ACJ0KI_01105 [Dehalococcoidia bacterium]